MDKMENPQLQLASDFVRYTNKNIFLTGKAGTGKTTFLHNLKREAVKRMIIVAPTGVAAINAGGVTIHSFFQLPFGPQIPKRTGVVSDFEEPPVNADKQSAQHKFSKEKVNIIRSIDLLVIDEISMVRADMLDAIDEVLRRYRDRYKPFGGVQLLMIGDLQQLAPIVKDSEWDLLRAYYDTVFFFSSLALRQTELVSIELKHIYRQSDERFIRILNQVRENRIDTETLAELNKRYIPNFEYDESERYITLTTHNNQAQSINSKKLDAIKEAPVRFTATVSGDFPEYSYPTDKELTLKQGAQVMFVKNDSSREKLYYNGKIGSIVDIDEEVIWVQCPKEEDAIAVQRAEWQNFKFSIDPNTDEITESVIGSFIQYPLKLAWAITIHKSQGLTFERAIVDAQLSFASGQVYVALSRCKTLEGLVLRSPIQASSIKTDVTVDSFSRHVEENLPSEQQLAASKREYERLLLVDLFGFDHIGRMLGYTRKVAAEHAESTGDVLRNALAVVAERFRTEIADVAAKFQYQLSQFCAMPQEVETNEFLQERVIKGAGYFKEKVNAILVDELDSLAIDIDNKAVKKSIVDSIGRIENEVRQKLVCLEATQKGFKVADYLHTRAVSAIDKAAPKKDTPSKVSSEIVNPQLYLALKNWRNLKAEELNVPHYLIMPQKTLFEILDKLPTSVDALKRVKGFGEKKVRQFGSEIVQIVMDYCDDEGIDYSKAYKMEMPEEPKKQKVDTKMETLRLFREGRSLQEIADERNFSRSTIEKHITDLIANDDVAVEALLAEERIDEITRCMREAKSRSVSELKAALGDGYSYAEIRFVLASLNVGS